MVRMMAGRWLRGPSCIGAWGSCRATSSARMQTKTLVPRARSVPAMSRSQTSRTRSRASGAAGRARCRRRLSRPRRRQPRRDRLGREKHVRHGADRRRRPVDDHDHPVPRVRVGAIVGDDEGGDAGGGAGVGAGRHAGGCGWGSRARRGACSAAERRGRGRARGRMPPVGLRRWDSLGCGGRQAPSRDLQRFVDAGGPVALGQPAEAQATLAFMSRWGNRAWSWNETPTWRRRGVTCTRARPAHLVAEADVMPGSRRSRPAMQRSRVAFLAPEGPRAP